MLDMLTIRTKNVNRRVTKSPKVTIQALGLGAESACLPLLPNQYSFCSLSNGFNDPIFLHHVFIPVDFAMSPTPNSTT